ncbi:hypothetical protein Tco_0636077 [Tanacetum coccineum]
MSIHFAPTEWCQIASLVLGVLDMMGGHTTRYGDFDCGELEREGVKNLRGRSGVRGDAVCARSDSMDREVLQSCHRIVSVCSGSHTRLDVRWLWHNEDTGVSSMTALTGRLLDNDVTIQTHCEHTDFVRGGRGGDRDWGLSSGRLSLAHGSGKTTRRMITIRWGREVRKVGEQGRD